jgi:hypothetical protein
MKNIHVLPTDKPSRLYKIENKLGLLEEPNRNFLAKNQHIYITSDEEIKEGDWCLDLRDNSVFKIKLPINGVGLICKIILTDNQDLIADGVQAIDDEFLEWFFKNPSCEFVEVELQIKSVQLPQKQLSKNSYDLSFRWIDVTYYKIIIPQEEPKQETLEEAARRYTESTTDNDAIRIFSFIEGAKSEAAKDYWFEQFKNKGGDK